MNNSGLFTSEMIAVRKKELQGGGKILCSEECRSARASLSFVYLRLHLCLWARAVKDDTKKPSIIHHPNLHTQQPINAMIWVCGQKVPVLMTHSNQKAVQKMLEQTECVGRSQLIAMISPQCLHLKISWKKGADTVLFQLMKCLIRS